MDTLKIFLSVFISVFIFHSYLLYWKMSHSWRAAAAKSLQLCPTLCNPIDRSPPGSPVPGILQARTLEWVPISFSNVSSGHVWMWELDYKESWAPKNWCFWTVVLVKTLEGPLDCKEIQPVHPKGDQFWVFIGRTDVEAETPILWPPDANSWLIWKDSDAGKDWGQEEKGTTEEEIFGWHHRLDGHRFGWTSGVGDGQGVLTCCGSWDRKESDMAEQLNWTELNAWKWKVKAKSLSCVWLLATPWTAAYQTPLSMGFSRQEYWSGLPLPSPIHGWREFISFWCPWSYEYWIQYCALEGDQWPHVYHKMVQYDLKNDVFIVTNQETKNEHRNLKVILYWLLCSIQINWYFNCKILVPTRPLSGPTACSMFPTSLLKFHGQLVYYCLVHTLSFRAQLSIHHSLDQSIILIIFNFV